MPGAPGYDALRDAAGIASIYQIWTIEEEAGRTYTSSIGGGMNSSVLLPFGLTERSVVRKSSSFSWSAVTVQTGSPERVWTHDATKCRTASGK